MILPWRVDVPEERRPWMNWLIIVATVWVSWLQLTEAFERESPSPGAQRPGLQTVPGTPTDPSMTVAPYRPGITETFMLDGWGLKGLFGYMWLHGGLLHLLGNMWFLWVFGNAVCAKIGNSRYLLLYVLLGVAAGVTHLLAAAGPVVGASGAINGIVGMFLVLFPENEIICYWSPIIVYWKQFTIRSFWVILIWLFWDVVGAFFLGTGSGTAYFAHLGGFGVGFAVAWLMCRRGWITMERYEKSLLQMWQERKQGHPKPSYDPSLGRLGLEMARDEQPQLEPIPLPAGPPKPVPYLNLDNGSVAPPDDFIRATCSCGRTIRASRQYGGKIVRCPACKGTVMMPESIDPEHPRALTSVSVANGPIRFACPCGKRIKAPACYAGRWGKCPQCNAKVRIPTPGGPYRGKQG
jgi:membrane associated rhomboid family serine protease